MRSDYKYAIIEGVICIEDLNIGGTSVTNNIENVIDGIVSKDPEISLLKKILAVYRDSQGEWDEVRIKINGKFESFAYIGVDNLDLAIKVVKNRRKNK